METELGPLSREDRPRDFLKKFGSTDKTISGDSAGIFTNHRSYSGPRWRHATPMRALALTPGNCATGQQQAEVKRLGWAGLRCRQAGRRQA